MKKHKIGWQTTKKERLSYYLFFSGQLIFNTIVPAARRTMPEKSQKYTANTTPTAKVACPAPTVK